MVINSAGSILWTTPLCGRTQSLGAELVEVASLGACSSWALGHSVVVEVVIMG